MKRRTHFTWSVERENKCPKCRSLTVLITAPSQWHIHEDGYREQGGKRDLPDWAPVEQEEISAHWCPKCERISSLSLNT